MEPLPNSRLKVAKSTSIKSAESGIGLIGVVIWPLALATILLIRDYPILQAEKEPATPPVDTTFPNLY